jgi:glutamate dehydrogenase/leucine dehydrogenase
MKVMSLAKRSLKLATVSMLAAGVTLVAAPIAANAGGISPSANRCYTQWWNTSWAQRCDGATLAAKYTSNVKCSWPEIPNRSLTATRSVGSTDTFWGADCMYGAYGGTITVG